MSDALLEVSGLRVSATTGDGDCVDIVAGAALKASKRQVVGIVGESGSGKTMTLRAIVNLLPPGVSITSGSVLLHGEDLVGASPAALRKVRGGRVGMVFQEPMTALDPTMRVGLQIAEGARLHLGLSRAKAHERAVELLDQVGIADPRRRATLYPHQLSGGMRQRVMVAIALSGEPDLLLCDEPTTALDATVTLQVLNLLEELARTLDVGVVIVTHDLGVVARVCSDVVVMYAGSVIETGAAEHVLRRPRHPYTLSLLRAVPTRDSTIDDLAPIPGAPPEPSSRPTGCPFAPRCALVEPPCREGVQLTELDLTQGPGAPDIRLTACRRHQLLSTRDVTAHV